VSCLISGECTKRCGIKLDAMRDELFLTQYCSGYKIEKNQMGAACSAYGEEDSRIQSFGGEI